MGQELPELDREAFRQMVRVAFEQAMDRVVEAVDQARSGHLIRDSEEPAREALEEFRRVAYETAVQMKVDAAEAAFSPKGPGGAASVGAAPAQQGPAAHERAHDQRPAASAAHSLA